MRKIIEHIIIILSLVSIVAMFCVFMFWWLYPYQTSTQKQPYEVLTKEIHQGEMMVYKIDYCKYTDKIPTVSRQFIDGIIYAVPQGNAQLKQGCGHATNSIRVPTSLPPGEYYVHATVVWQMNPIRTITKEYETEKFTVLKK